MGATDFACGERDALLVDVLLSTTTTSDAPGTCAMSVEKHSPSFDENLKTSGADRDVVVESELVSPSAEERRLVRKLDWRIMPIACIMYLFACTSPRS